MGLSITNVCFSHTCTSVFALPLSIVLNIWLIPAYHNIGLKLFKVSYFTCNKSLNSLTLIQFHSDTT